MTFEIFNIFELSFYDRDICKRIMIERSLQVDNGSSNSTMGRFAIRPTDLPTNQRWMRPREYINKILILNEWVA
jgi:hypothetical protein